jgi:hypothetical protein
MDQKPPEDGPMASSGTPADGPLAMPAGSPPAIPAKAVPAPATAAPPPVAWDPSVPAAAPAGRVTDLAKLAAAILMFFGLLVVFGGWLVWGIGALPGGAGQWSQDGIVLMIIGLIGILAGIGAWRGNKAGRIVGIILGVLFALAAVFGFSSSSESGWLGFSVGVVLLFAYVEVVLPFRWKAPAMA